MTEFEQYLGEWRESERARAMSAKTNKLQREELRKEVRRGRTATNRVKRQLEKLEKEVEVIRKAMEGMAETPAKLGGIATTLKVLAGAVVLAVLANPFLMTAGGQKLINKLIGLVVS